MDVDIKTPREIPAYVVVTAEEKRIIEIAARKRGRPISTLLYIALKRITNDFQDWSIVDVPEEAHSDHR